MRRKYRGPDFPPPHPAAAIRAARIAALKERASVWRFLVLRVATRPRKTESSPYERQSEMAAVPIAPRLGGGFNSAEAGMQEPLRGPVHIGAGLGQSHNADLRGVPGGAAPPAPIKEDPEGGFFQNHKFAIIVAVVVLCVFLLVLYLYLTRRGGSKKKKKDVENEGGTAAQKVDMREVERFREMRRQRGRRPGAAPDSAGVGRPVYPPADVQQQPPPVAAAVQQPPPDAQAPVPAAQQQEPPAAQQQEPPAAQQQEPPAAQQQEPPAAQQQEPPAAQQQEPPAAQQQQVPNPNPPSEVGSPGDAEINALLDSLT